jgi:hypothetical protein
MITLKSALLLALLPAAAVSAWVVHHTDLVCGAFRCGTPVPALYVEARSASVFAGACHYNGEYPTQGRELIAGWRLDGASTGNAELDGVELVVAVAGDRNLEEPDAVRRSVVYLDPELDAARADAAVAWLRGKHAALVGEVLEVRRADVSVTRTADAFAVRAGDGVAFEGAALPDRACCSMPSEVWYAPEVELDGRLVGHVETFRLDEPRLGVDTERHDENSAFLGFLPVPRSCCSKPCGETAAP